MWRLLIPVFATGALAIWPIPKTYSTGNDVVWIDGDVKVHYYGPSKNSSEANSTQWTRKIVDNAIERTHDSLFHKNFVPWKFHPRMSDFEPEKKSSSSCVTHINLHQNQSDPDNIMRPTIETLDESYTLSMTTDGNVDIAAKSSIGLLHGLTSFAQLFYRHSDGGVYSPKAPVHIVDAPLFPHRGVNFDSSRTWKSVKEIKATIDAMSFNKLNRFHWHITDAQAWPLVIPSMPELADKGAYASWQKYSPADVKSVQEYGALNGVEVILEIDQPGHTSSIAFAYPELIAAFNIQPNWDDYAAEPPSGTFKLDDPAVPQFLEKLFDDLLPRLKPYSSYFHLGGDEVNANAYTLDSTVKSNDSKVLQPLLQKFMDRNQKQLKAAGFTPFVWEEQAIQWNLTMPNNTIVQAWETSTAVIEIVKKGFRAIAGDSNYWYEDCGQGQWLDFFPGASSEQYAANAYQDYCSPRKNWRWMYSYDPLAGVPAHLQHLVVGGEVSTWSEQIDEVSIDNIMWPRTCAAGEVLWSGAKDPATGQNRSQITASPRLSEMRERLVARGIKAEPIQMPFCTMNGTQCAL